MRATDFDEAKESDGNGVTADGYHIEFQILDIEGSEWLAFDFQNGNKVLRMVKRYELYFNTNRGELSKLDAERALCASNASLVDFRYQLLKKENLRLKVKIFAFSGGAIAVGYLASVIVNILTK